MDLWTAKWFCMKEIIFSLEYYLYSNGKYKFFLKIIEACSILQKTRLVACLISDLRSQTTSSF
jgi:hypothetical protein